LAARKRPISACSWRYARTTLTPLPQLVSLAEAVDWVEETFVRHDLLTDELADDLTRFRDHAETDPEWPAQGDRLGTRAASSEQLSVFVEFRQRGDEGWFVSLTVGLPLEGGAAASR
jgi:hypothetical protein